MKYILALIIALSATAEVIAGPTINAKAGEDVTFNLEGNAERVVFYSGENNHSY